MPLLTGRRLLEHVLERADTDGTPAWLETSDAANVGLYEKVRLPHHRTHRWRNLPTDLLGDGASGTPADRSRRHGHGCGPGLGSRRPVAAPTRSRELFTSAAHPSTAEERQRYAEMRGGHQGRVIPPLAREYQRGLAMAGLAIRHRELGSSQPVRRRSGGLPGRLRRTPEMHSARQSSPRANTEKGEGSNTAPKRRARMKAGALPASSACGGLRLGDSRYRSPRRCAGYPPAPAQESLN
jgi:hypothetical protein